MNTELAKYIIDSFNSNNKTIVELSADKLKLISYNKNLESARKKTSMEWLYVLKFDSGKNIVPRKNNQLILKCPDEVVGFTNRPFKKVKTLDLKGLVRKWEGTFKNSPPNAALYFDGNMCIITITNMVLEKNEVILEFDYVNSIDNQCVIPPRFDKGVLFIDSDDVSSRVKKIVADQLGIDEAKVTDEASFIDDLGADSLDTVELVMAFEEEFDTEIPEDEAEEISTVGDAVKFIEENQ